MENRPFEQSNRGFNHTFKLGRLSVGLVVPIEEYSSSSHPTMENQLEVIQQADQLGFSAVWLRDIPFEVPSFGDVGQIFDPWVYLGALAQATQNISLGVASIILPLRHPAHIAKAAASVDQLSNGRLLLGIASGDRPSEYPSMAIDFSSRSQAFRDSYEYIRKASEKFPSLENQFGKLSGFTDILPKPNHKKIPLLITGFSQQSYDWLVENGDGWMNYPKSIALQKQQITSWRQDLIKMKQPNKPVMQPLYIDLKKDNFSKIEGIHLGLRCHAKNLVEYLKKIESNGVNHVALNLRFNNARIEDTLEILAKEVLPEF